MPDDLRQAPPLSFPEMLYRSLVEPLLGRAPGTELPPPGQMPGQPVPPQQGPGVSDILSLAAVPAAGAFGVAPLVYGLLGSKVGSYLGGQAGKLAGGLGGPEWAARGQQVGETLGQFAVPGRYMPELVPQGYEPFRLKRPEIELPEKEELLALLESYRDPGKKIIEFLRDRRPSTDAPASDTAPLLANRELWRNWYSTAPYLNPRTPKENFFPSQVQRTTSGLLSLNPDRLPVRTVDTPITYHPDVSAYSVAPPLEAALDTIHTLFPTAVEQLKGVEVLPARMLGSKNADYNTRTGVIRIPDELLKGRIPVDYDELVGTLTHELEHQSQYSPKLSKALGVDAKKQAVEHHYQFDPVTPNSMVKVGMERSDRVEPPAMIREHMTRMQADKARRGENPRLTPEERQQAEQQGLAQWQKVRPLYEKKWRNIGEARQAELAKMRKKKPYMRNPD